MYDLIGDIHGHADELVQLLEALGYQKAQGVYRHPERKVIFLGDFIDRGPKIRQVLEIVRPMIEEGKALAVMGNHELNALAYHTEDPESPGEYLRRRSPKNEKQHRKTVEQLKPDELVSYLDWFRTLPMWLDLDGLRVVHACWDEQAINTIAQALDGTARHHDRFLAVGLQEGKRPFRSGRDRSQGQGSGVAGGHVLPGQGRQRSHRNPHPLVLAAARPHLPDVCPPVRRNRLRLGSLKSR